MAKKTMVQLYSTPIGGSSVTISSLMLFAGTILYTDGTVSSTTSNAFQTLETNKYKIKSNVLFRIDNAYYVTISN